MVPMARRHENHHLVVSTSRAVPFAIFSQGCCVCLTDLISNSEDYPA